MDIFPLDGVCVEGGTAMRFKSHGCFLCRFYVRRACVCVCRVLFVGIAFLKLEVSRQAITR